MALPAQQVLLRVVDLPTPDPAELEGMIELQVDKLSPFPVENLIVSYERLEVTESATRVLIAAVQRQRAEELGDVFHDLGTELWRIDVDVLGWWRLLKDEAGGESRGVQVTVLALPDDTLLVVSQDGIPMLLRFLGDPDETGRAEYLEAVAEEINYTLTSVEAESGSDLGAADDRLARSAGRVRPGRAPVASAGRRRGARPWPLSPLSVGLARRAADEAEGTVNLAPPEWQSTRESRKWRKNLIIASSVLLSAWLVLVVAFLATLGSRKAGLARLQGQAEALAAPAAEVKQIQEKITFLEQYKDRSRSGLEVLRAVTLSLPANVELTAFIYKKGSKLTLRGEADQEKSAFDFYQNLQDDPLMGEVTPGKVQRSTSRGSTRAVFSVTASLGEEETP